jgi:hypothetical protein
MNINSGDILRGTFMDGVLTGDGELKRINGEKYTGQFVAGEPHGKGELIREVTFIDLQTTTIERQMNE